VLFLLGMRLDVFLCIVVVFGGWFFFCVGRVFLVLVFLFFVFGLASCSRFVEIC
jgi:hypothetical protein